MGSHPAVKVAAAMAAVLQYLAEAQPETAVPPGRPAPTTPPGFASWGLAGRQESMALRDLWQRRLTRSW
ncbi:MAG: hypothetical protein SCH98_02375 [Deferrisomatales bacterium]|nr:hypothetical protein [Deferrisomatales bacterium]